MFIVEIHNLEDTGHGELACIIGDALREKSKSYEKVIVGWVDDKG